MPLQGARDRLCVPASPYGAPLRRLQSLGPRFPLIPISRACARSGGCKERALGVYLTPGGLSKDSRDHECESWPQAPIPIHVRFRRGTPLRRMGMMAIYALNEIQSIAFLLRMSGLLRP